MVPAPPEAAEHISARQRTSTKTALKWATHAVLVLTDAVEEAEEGGALWVSSRPHKRKSEEWMAWGGGVMGRGEVKEAGF